MAVWRGPRLFLGIGAVALAALFAAVLTFTLTVSPASKPPLRVSGAHLVNAAGALVVPRGVDLSGTEYQCVQGNGVFASPADQASVSAMKHWGVNTVRLPLNEACWNGEPYVDPRYAGENYRRAIADYVQLLHRNGLLVILDLHWSDGWYPGPGPGCPTAQATCQKPMPDAEQAVPFWSSVARTFSGDDDVIFDLFNEAFPTQALRGETPAWQCWLHGGRFCSPGIAYPVAGMQTLVDAIRAAGADNVLMLGGLSFGNDLSHWLRYEPADPDHNLVASFHAYNFNSCVTQACWDAKVAPVAAKVPVIAGEIGEDDCSDAFVTSLMSWLDRRADGYLAWSWNPASSCYGGEPLITDDTGKPTPYGAGVRAHLRSIARR